MIVIEKHTKKSPYVMYLNQLKMCAPACYLSYACCLFSGLVNRPLLSPPLPLIRSSSHLTYLYQPVLRLVNTIVSNLGWLCMRSSRVVRASDKVATVPEFDPSILRHSGIWGAVDEAVLKKVQFKNPPANLHCRSDLLCSVHCTNTLAWHRSCVLSR